MRKFIRHPTRIPIQVRCATAEDQTSTIHDVAIGGLRFASDNPVNLGCLVVLKFAIHDNFEARGRVVWCHAAGDHYDVGVQFDDDYTKYAVRMVEQVCWIEDYRQRVREQEGRNLSRDEAASEWIARYAGEFPGRLDPAH